MTLPDENSVVIPVSDVLVDTGHASQAEAEAAGIRVGTPVVCRPRVLELAGERIAGTSIEDRAGCAVLLEVVRSLAGRPGGPTVHVVFSVEEEFNLRGAAVAARALAPDIAIQIDIMPATDTPGVSERGSMMLGVGPGASLGAAVIDVGFPLRHSHSSLEDCDLRDLEGLARLLVACLDNIGPDLSLSHDREPP